MHNQATSLPQSANPNVARDVHSADENGNTPLHNACSRGDVCATKQLLSNEHDPDQRNNKGDTALHCAFRCKDQRKLEDIIQVLIEHGADVNLEDEKGNVPLYEACCLKNADIVRMLLKYKADPNKKDRKGETALYWALEAGNDVVDLLLEYGADVNIRNGRSDLVLNLAIEMGNVCIAEKFLKHKANPNELNLYGDPSLYHAINNIAYELYPTTLKQMVELLLEHGADVNQQNKKGFAALGLACATCNVELVELLLRKGADLQQKDDQGNSPLHSVFVELRHEPDGTTLENIVELLIKSGPDVNIRNLDGRTPLHEASLTGNIKTVKMLLANKADINAEANSGNTPLDNAIIRKHKQIIDILRKSGANVTNINDHCDKAASLLWKDDLPIEQTSIGALRLVELAESRFFHQEDQDSSSSALTEFLEELSFISNVVNFHIADKRGYKVLEITQNSLKKIMLVWLTYFGNSADSNLIFEKLRFLLDQTHDRNKLGDMYHRRNFLHHVTSNLHVMFNNRPRYCFHQLLDLEGRFADASVLNARDGNGWTSTHILLLSCDLLLKSENSIAFESHAITSPCSKSISAKLKKGFRVTTKDRHGASVIHYAAGSGMSGALELLLEECEEAFINDEDINGATALHYAAFANSVDAVELLLFKGCEREKRDAKGRTASELAKLLGYDDIVQLLDGGDGLWNPDIVIRKDIHRIKQPEEGMDFMKFTEQLKQDAGEMDIDAVYTSLLKSPVLGSMNNQEECFKEETRLVKDEVMKLIKRFSEHFGRRYPTFAFNPKLRGSMAENTKCGPPDEFDVMLIMDDISEYFRVIFVDNCKAILFLSDSTLPELFDINIDQLLSLSPRDMIDVLHHLLENRQFRDERYAGILQPRELLDLLYFSLRKFLLVNAACEGSRLKFVSCDLMGEWGFCLKLLFHGHLYKFLQISVDLVPCIRLNLPVPVRVNIKWPVPLDFSKCQLYALFRGTPNGMALSSTDYEEVLLKSLPSAAKDAYVLGKAFNSVKFKWIGPDLSKIFRKSYKLKRALLLCFQKKKNAQNFSRHNWIEALVSVASDMGKYVSECHCHCRRCIFNVKKWTRDVNDCLNLFL